VDNGLAAQNSFLTHLNHFQTEENTDEKDKFARKKVISLLSHYRYNELSVEQNTQLRAWH
jgi:hypothetical protein